MAEFKGRGLKVAVNTALSAALIFSVADSADAKSRKKKRIAYKPAPERLALISIDSETNEVLSSQYADELRHPASLTKVMTLYLLFDAIESGKVKLDDRVLISANAARQAPTKLGAPAGTTISVEEAIYSLVIKSANDVATAVAEKLGGTESKFAAMMTAKSRAIGMEKTVFLNASGLPDVRQVSTARDLATMSQAIMRDHPDMYPYFSAKETAFGTYHLRTHNRLLGQVDGVDGIKTGYTRMSGFNLTTSAVRDGHRVVAVVLGGQTARSRDLKMQMLLEDAFADLSKRSGMTLASASGQPRIAFSALPTNLRTRPIVSAPAGASVIKVSPFALGATTGGSSARADALTLDGLHGNTDVVPDLY